MNTQIRSKQHKISAPKHKTVEPLEKYRLGTISNIKVQVGNDQEKAQSEEDSHFKNRGGKRKLSIIYLYHNNWGF